MKINATAAYNIYKTSAIKSHTESGTGFSLDQADSERSVKTDQVSISSAASRQLEVGKVTKSLMEEIAKPTSPQRLAQLQQAVQAGTYHIPTEKLASAVMQHWFGL